MDHDRVNRQYRERGYVANLVEDDAGAHLLIRRRGVLVGEVVVGVFTSSTNAPVSVVVRRFQPSELSDVTVTDVPPPSP